MKILSINSLCEYFANTIIQAMNIYIFEMKPHRLRGRVLTGDSWQLYKGITLDDAKYNTPIKLTSCCECTLFTYHKNPNPQPAISIRLNEHCIRNGLPFDTIFTFDDQTFEFNWSKSLFLDYNILGPTYFHELEYVPKQVIYNYEQKRFHRVKWGDFTKDINVKRWLTDNGLDPFTLQIPEELQTLFKLQVGFDND